MMGGRCRTHGVGRLPWRGRFSRSLARRRVLLPRRLFCRWHAADARAWAGRV